MSTRNLVWVAIVVAIATMLWRLPPMAAKQDSVYRTYSPLVEVDALIRQRFVEPIHDERLVDGAIRGMMLKLDPYSGYIAPEEMAAFERRTTGNFIGVGLEIGVQHGQLTVIAPVEGGPAIRAGVRAGDIVLAIDERSTEELSVFDADELMVGSPGSSVALKFRRPATGEELTLPVVRGPVSLNVVKGFRRQPDGSWSYVIDPQERIAYVRVSSFCESTTSGFERALARAAGEAEQILTQAREAGEPGMLPTGAALRGLIIDLRYNPGGLLVKAVEMADHFIASGVIVSTVTRRQAVDRYNAHPENTLVDLPLAILVNGASASASEIVAGALQDYGRAVVVGERTFGKGSVQHVIPLTEHHAAIRLTVAFYQLPKGRIIHKTPRNAHTDAWGIMPDVLVSLTPDEAAAVQASRHAVDGLFVDDPVAAARAAQEIPADADAQQIIIDRQLQAALDVVRLRAAESPTQLGSASILAPKNGSATPGITAEPQRK
ncbi:MAG TPA: S41 family peptidase [Phycisphaerae bacterium]|jgi:carboxyl-terminal processing protease